MITLSRRAEVAAALAAAGDRGVSGEAIAISLGISRVAVSKHVAALRSLGYEIAAAPRAGYRLTSAPDACIPEEVGPRLGDPLWVACEGALELVSTSDEAKRLARSGAPEGTVVVAGRQTGGRGRFGRVWESPEGGVYVSCVLRPPLSPAEVAPLSLVIAVGAARALESLGVKADLKWPNDLQVTGAKLGGILLEMAAESDRTEWVVAGCGVNVATSPGPASASVRESAPAAGIATIAAVILDGIADAYREFLTAGFASIRAEFERRSALTGHQVKVRDANGGKVAEGTVTGIAEDGSLMLEGDGAVARVAAGEVTLRD